jgi:integrase/recombinase XerC
MTPTVTRWLDSLPNPRTRATYAAGLEAFMRHAHISVDAQLQAANTRQVRAYLNSLRDSGQQPGTVNNRRAAIAAFYRYAETTEGWPANPAARIKATKVSAYGHARYPSTDQVRQLLAVIPSDTAAGLRNLAIILGMYTTTRRINEWIQLRWSDIQHGPNGHWFTYTAKGGLEDRQAIPSDLWRIVETWLRFDGRYPPAADAYIFTPVSPSDGRHISAGYIRQVLRKYGKLAGLPAELCHPHGLRHAGARARKAAGQSPWELQKVLSHKNIRTTMIYTDTVLDEPADQIGDALVSAVLPAKFADSR